MFNHLHMHTMLSLLDSTTGYKEYVNMAKECGQNAIAFTEHGNIYNWMGKKLYCDSMGIKYIHGIEIYLTENSNEKIRDNYHTVLLAKNAEGLKEINLLVGLSTKDDHSYYKPRISFDEFLSTSNNIIRLSACLQSPLNRIDEKNPYFKKLLQKYDFFEVQPHVNSDEQKEFNKRLVEFSKEYGKGLIATNDVHSSTPYKAECRKILQKAKGIHFKGDDTNKIEEKFDLTFKTEKQMRELFKEQGILTDEEINSAINNTQVVSDMCEDVVVDKSFKYPKISDNDEGLLKEVINNNYKKKTKDGIIAGGKIYIDQIHEEFRVFKKLNMLTFMLFMSQLVTWCKENGIQVGPSRGSVAGSLIAYLTNITDVDPIKWGTIFSRFANEDRMETGDIDIDLPTDSRDIVYKHIFDSFGMDKVAYVLAIGTISEKGTIDEIGRALEYNLDYVAKIKEEYESNPEKAKIKYKELFYYFDGLVNTAISQSIHPAGIVVSPITLPDNYGVFWKDGQPIMQIDMEDIHDCGLNKYDLLALKNINIIRDTCSNAGIRYPMVHEINFEDENVWKDITCSRVGLFEFEKPYAFDLLKKYDPHTVDDISLVNAALRPSGASYRDRLINHEINKNPSEKIDEIFSTSLGYCIEENQYVNTITGNKKIKDVNIGDVIYSENDINKVINKKYMGKKDTIKISTDSSSVICTNDHKILTEYGWKKAEDINIGECIAYRIGTNSTKEYPIKKLKIIGYLLGDGILNGKNNVQFVNLDINSINDFKSCIESEFEDLTCSIRTTITRVNKYNLYYANVRHITNSKEETNLSKYLKEIGLKKYPTGGCLAKEKFIPEFIFSLNRNCLLNLIGAYTDTDSHIGVKKNSVSYKTSSFQLAKDIVEIGRLLGYKFTISKSEDAYDIIVNNSLNYLQEIYKYSNKVKNLNNLSMQKKQRELSYSRITRSNLVSIFDKNGINKKKVYIETGVNMYQKHKYIGISSVMKICKKYKNINEIIPSYLKNENIIWTEVKNIEKYGISNVYDIEIEKEHNFSCNGIIVHNCVFQEQITRFLQELCGYSGSGADNCRRLIARKKPEELEKELPKIVKGYCENSSEDYETAKSQAEVFVKVIEDASRYAFGYNHSTGYSIIAYYCAYFRYYYPGEFITAYLNTANSQEDIQDGSELAKIKHINIESAKFRKSIDKYVYDKETKTIYKGLASIKYISTDCANQLYDLRMVKFETFTDLLIYLTENTTINSRQVKVLVSIGFFEEFGKVGKLLDIFNLFVLRYKKTYVDATKIKRIVEIKEFEIKTGNRNLPITEQVNLEKEYMGYISFTIDIQKRYVYVLGTDLKYTPRITVYCLATGKSIQLKVNKKIYAKNKIHEGDILYCKKFVKKEDWKKTEDGFARVGTYSEFLEDYDIINEERINNVLHNV